MARFRNLGEGFAPSAPADAPALVDLGAPSRRSYSYGDLRELSAAAARGLSKRGLGAGNRVAILSANRAEFLLAAFGALRAGMTVIPVNNKLPEATVRLILEDNDVALVFHDREHRGLCPPNVAGVEFGAPGGGGFDALLGPGPFDSVEPGKDDVAMVIYTSGTTGRPKGVLFNHRGHLWALDQRSNASTPQGQRTIVAAPLYHQNGLASAQATLATGGTVILLPRFTAKSFIQAVVDYRIEMITAVPTMIALVAREEELLAGLDLSFVKMVRVSSAPSTPTLLRQIRGIFPNAVIVNGFGTTEGGPVCFGPHPGKLPQPMMSVGYRHPEVDLRLVRDGAVVADEGVLQIRSPAVMMGYHKQPDLTAKVITSDGYYITGDFFRIDENGFYYFLRRADDMFVCGGENVYPDEIEALLLRHPAVEQACIVAVEDEIKGHKPVAFVVRGAGSTVTEQELKDYALANAPAYQHPRRIWFLPELPLASTNKVDRRALAERATRVIQSRHEQVT